MALDYRFNGIRITNGPSKWDLILALFESDMVSRARRLEFKTEPNNWLSGININAMRRVWGPNFMVIEGQWWEFEGEIDRHSEIKIIGIYNDQRRIGIVWRYGKEEIKREDAFASLRSFLE